MNGAEFFMQHAGCKLLPAELVTGDVVADAASVLSINLPQHTGKTLRLSSCWMVITPSKVTTSFKAHPGTGFDTSGESGFKDAVKAAAAAGEPFQVLKLGKRTAQPRDLFVSYDARAVRLCGQGITETVNLMEDPKWTS